MEPLQTIGLVLAVILLIHSAILWNWNQRLRINLLFAGLITLCISQFFPGMTNGDSNEIMLSAIHGPISDFHSPIMAIIWRFFCLFYKGPQLLFLFSQVCVWAGLYLITKDCLKDNYRSHVPLILFFLYPPNYSALSLVCKDSFFLCSMTLVMGCLGTGKASVKTPIRLGVGIWALVIAIGARHEAVFPVLPVVLAYFFTKGWSGYSLPFKLGAGFGAMAVLVLILKVIEYNVIEQYRYVEEWIYVYDLGNLSRDTNTMLIPADCLYPTSTLAEFKLVNGDANDLMTNRIVPETHDLVKIRELHQAWFQAVSSHIPLYLKNRWHTFAAFIGLADRINFSLFQFAEIYRPNAEEIKYGSVSIGQLSIIVGGVYLLLSGRLICLVCMTYIFHLFVMLQLWLRPNLPATVKRTALLLVAAGLAHSFIFFFLLPGFYFRYGYWMLFSSSLAVLLCFGADCHADIGEGSLQRSR